MDEILNNRVPPYIQLAAKVKADLIRFIPRCAKLPEKYQSFSFQVISLDFLRVTQEDLVNEHLDVGGTNWKKKVKKEKCHDSYPLGALQNNFTILSHLSFSNILLLLLFSL